MIGEVRDLCVSRCATGKYNKISTFLLVSAPPIKATLHITNVKTSLNETCEVFHKIVFVSFLGDTVLLRLADVILRQFT